MMNSECKDPDCECHKKKEPTLVEILRSLGAVGVLFMALVFYWFLFTKLIEFLF
jgi:hypothetical protein